MLKSEKLKKLSKSGNSPNFDATEAGPSFLILETKRAFNCLRLAFTKAFILRYFDLEWHIWIEINALGCAITGVFTLVASRTRPDKVVFQTDLGQ